MNLSERRAQIVEFDRQFRLLIKSSPDKETSRDLNVALDFFRKRYYEPLDIKAQKITELLESGLTTTEELRGETRYRIETILKILKNLEDAKKIRVTTYPITGRGRPTKRYFLI